MDKCKWCGIIKKKYCHKKLAKEYRCGSYVVYGDTILNQSEKCKRACVQIEQAALVAQFQQEINRLNAIIVKMRKESEVNGAM